MTGIKIGATVYNKSGVSAIVMAVDGENLTVITTKGIRIINVSSIVPISIGDRVTLVDKYQVRAGDVGTVEAISGNGYRIPWDSNPQPPQHWRIFPVEDLELVERGHYQN